MKEKIKIALIILAVFLFLCIPVVYTYKDGGSKSYKSVIYEVHKYNSIMGDGDQRLRGYTVEILGMEVYNHTYIVKLENQPDEELQNDNKETLPSEASDSTIKYTENKDGTYTCDGIVYKYKLVLSGTDTSSKKEATCIVLTNDETLTFEEVFKSLISSDVEVGEPRFVFLDWVFDVDSSISSLIPTYIHHTF